MFCSSSFFCCKLDADTKKLQLISIRRLNLDKKSDLVAFCVAIADTIEQQTNTMWTDVHPVLSFLVANFFPVTFLPSCVGTLLRLVNFESSKRQNFYQVSRK